MKNIVVAIFLLPFLAYTSAVLGIGISELLNLPSSLDLVPGVLVALFISHPFQKLLF